MLKYSYLFVLFLTVGGATAQVTTKPADVKPPDAKPDYSKEAFVDEQDHGKIVFENDGTSTREASLRLRIQSDAGVQRYGVLSFSYQAATESVEIDYVRVKKPDGRVVVTPPENIQDMPSDITRQAPFYSDLHEKHVAVKGLGVGDVLETHVRWHVTKPLAPGQFWFAFSFPRDFIVLHQEIQVSVPRERAVKWKSPDFKPVITEDGSRRIFAWTHSQMEHLSADQEKKDREEKIYQAGRGKLPPPDGEISSFQSWEEIGAWYNSLQQERVKPTAEIRAKAAELTKDAKDNDAKLHAIYNYVSTQFRYIGVAFGIGRYQPHTAAEVLANQYGDCKDKHTLLASLLEAAGIKAYPALINSSREIDLDVPSPGQFDHVITAVPQGNGFVWLDTTTEVAPFGYLVSPLREKRALLIAPDKPATLTSTAAEPPFAGLQTFKIEAKLSDSGTLEGKVDRALSGDDVELLFRAAFRRVPLPQWKDLIQKISYGSGFSGDVREVSASAPEKTDEPFRISYAYTRKDFPEWSEHRITSPLPAMLVSPSEDKFTHPFLLGATGKIQYESRVELPKGYYPELPGRLDLADDFAEYHAAYSIKDGILQTTRAMTVKLREVPVAEYEAYKKFAKAVADDQDRFVELSSAKSPARSGYQDEIWDLPTSENSEAAQAYEDAREDFQKKEGPQAEITALKRAVDIDPKFTRAWLWLGEIYKYTGQREQAVQAYRKAIEVDPQRLVSYKALGFTLMGMRKYEDAVLVWQDLIKRSPQNIDGLASLATSLSSLKRYDEAAAVMESAIAVSTERPDLYASLGGFYVHAGNEEKALAAFKKTVELDPKPLWFNNIGYALAEAGKQLPMALEYAEKAVREEEESSAKVNLSDLKRDDLGYTPSLGAYWDTLGWVHFRLGNYDKAEKYLNAAWALGQHPTEADHLGQVYERQHKTQAAIHMYQLALAVSSGPPGATDNLPETRARLEHLKPGASAFGTLLSATSELSTNRTFKLPRITKETTTAEFFLLLGPGSTVANVKFVSGSDKLKSSDKIVGATDFHAVFPDAGPTRLLRRGILSCYSVTGCSFVLYNPNDVRSVN